MLDLIIHGRCSFELISLAAQVISTDALITRQDYRAGASLTLAPSCALSSQPSATTSSSTATTAY